MKIGYASDIHTEWGGQRTLACEPCDVLILAGDIGAGPASVAYAEKNFAQAGHIIMVAGNHDHWGGRYDKTIRLMREAADQGGRVSFLENDTRSLFGQVFIGATMWTDYRHGGRLQSANMAACQYGINDFRRIKIKENDRYHHVTPQFLYERHIESRDYIFKMVNHSRDAIVVTHHGPTHLSLHPDYAHTNDPINCAYVSDLGDLIADTDIKAWFHGHVHAQHDYMVNNTRVLLNAIGYPGYDLSTQIKYVEL
jgi:predicted phosphohydrolase